MGRLNTMVSLALLMVPVAVSSAAAESITFKVDSAGGSSMQFVSDAPLEKFTGKTTKLTGDVTTDPDHADKTKGEIKADASSIKTNVELRDEHLRGENWLDAKKYPHSTFVITKVSGADKLKANDVTDVKVTGKFTLHGVTKEITTPAKVRYTPGAKGSLRVQTSFTIHLDDYKVEIPKIVALKVSPDIVVNVDIRRTRAELQPPV